MFIASSYGVHRLADGKEQAPSLQKLTNKNAPAMVRARSKHHRKTLWVGIIIGRKIGTEHGSIIHINADFGSLLPPPP
jgi:hypothetical protein